MATNNENTENLVLYSDEQRSRACAERWACFNGISDAYKIIQYSLTGAFDQLQASLYFNRIVRDTQNPLENDEMPVDTSSYVSAS